MAADPGPDTPPALPCTRERVLAIMALFPLAFIVAAFALERPGALWDGLLAILRSRDTLTTDYMGLGGIGAALLNAGLLTLLALAVYWRSGAAMGGGAVACLWLVLGFGLFGKNLLNVWGIVAGVGLYARFKGEPFAKHVNTAFFGAALAPIFSEILFSSALTLPASLPLAVATTLLLGFVLVPAAAHLFHAHQGHSLYNMGFVAGLLGTLTVAVYKSYGFVPDPVFIWTQGHNLLLGSLLGALFAAMAAIGFALDRQSAQRELRLMRRSGRAPSDFVADFGFGPALLNMALTGLMGTAYVLAVGSDLNGPTLGAILCVVGFSAYGKHPANIVWIMLGVCLASITKDWNAAAPSAVLAALFGTTLAPIAGRFGWHWGLVAGFVHSSVAQTVGQLHGGLVLYNNGFAAGLVAAVLLPVILALCPTSASDEAPR
jgi:hypothetical protein